MTRQASGLTFDGNTSDRKDEPAPDDRSKGLHGWGSIDAGDTLYYRAFSLGWHSDGLAAWHKPTRTWRVYDMSALAEVAGWSSTRVSGDIYGLAGTRDRIWTGTNALGIMMLDVPAQRWSRYDVAQQPNPDRISFVWYADDAYVVASGGGRPGQALRDDLDSGYPGLEVYSIRYAAWLRISAVPRVNVRSLATNQGVKDVAMGCSQVQYAKAAYVPLRECGMSHPDRVAATGDGAAYEFEREFPPPGISGRFVIRRDQLEAAFSSRAR